MREEEGVVVVEVTACCTEIAETANYIDGQGRREGGGGVEGRGGDDGGGRGRR